MKLKILVVCSVILGMISCSDKEELSNLTDASDTNQSLQNDAGKNTNIQYEMQFARCLSQAIYERQDVRQFVKDEALKKIDNAYDVFFPIAKDKYIGNKTFKDVLCQYVSHDVLLDSIEKHVPMLNIHLPELGTTKVSDLNTSEAELPVLCGQKIFVNGEVVDSISDDEIPDFNVLVISENNTIQKKTSSTRSFDSNDNAMLGNNYEYVSPVFNPSYNKHNSILSTRSGGQKAPSDKYTNGKIPSSDLDPKLIYAYKVSKSFKRGTRFAMYYGLNNLNDTAMTLKSDVKDCIYKIKFSVSADFKDMTTNKGAYNFFNQDVIVKKSPITREDAIRRLINGRVYCFLFTFISGNEAQENVTTQSVRIYARPDQLFNLDVNRSKRHRTAFRHSRYAYSINLKNIASKWFYPLENNQFPILDRWNILKGPITKSVVVYLINPDEKSTTTTSESYTMKYSSDVNLGLGAKAKLFKILDLGINGKFDSSNSFEKTVTKTFSIAAHNLRIGVFKMDYFEDYPISIIYSDGSVVPMILGTGPITMSILPFSTDYLTQKRYNKQ